MILEMMPHDLWGLCKYKSSSEPKLLKNVTSKGSSEFLGRHPETLVLPHPTVRAASVCRTESREVQNKVDFYSFLKMIKFTCQWRNSIGQRTVIVKMVKADPKAIKGETTT